LSLRKFGYGVNKSETQRRKSLRKASEKFGSLKVLQRLNLIRNKQPRNNSKRSKGQNIMSEDVKYMSRYHKKNK